jgi:hypothetical protein
LRNKYLRSESVAAGIACTAARLRSFAFGIIQGQQIAVPVFSPVAYNGPESKRNALPKHGQWPMFDPYQIPLLLIN